MKNSSTSTNFQTQHGRLINGRITLKKNSNTKTIKNIGLQLITANYFLKKNLIHKITTLQTK